MPGMSGPMVAEMLTRMRPALKVVFMSGYTDDADRPPRRDGARRAVSAEAVHARAIGKQDSSRC